MHTQQQQPKGAEKEALGIGKKTATRVEEEVAGLSLRRRTDSPRSCCVKLLTYRDSPRLVGQQQQTTNTKHPHLLPSYRGSVYVFFSPYSIRLLVN